MYKSEKIAWAAGLFEGEGAIGIPFKNGRMSKSPCIQISMTDFDVMEEFVAIIGIGNLRGPYGPYKTKDRCDRLQKWAWSVTRWPDVIDVLILFVPYLKRRRLARAQELIDWMRTYPRSETKVWKSEDQRLVMNRRIQE